MKKKEKKQEKLSTEELEYEKQKILNFKKNQTEKPPETWSRIRERNEYSKKYTPEAYEPIKKWYNNTIYEPEIRKFDSTIPNSKLNELNLITDLQQKDLKTLLVKVFEKYKIIIEKNQSSKNISHNQYFINFFNTFMPKLLSCCILLENSLDYLKPYHQVFTLETFKEYLKNTPGLYSQMALWSIENHYPFPSNSIICNQHHVMPRFLYQKSNYGFSESEIEKPYNLVNIAWLLHILFHLVRLIEYNQQEEYRALTGVIALGNLNTTNKNFIAFRDISNPVLSVNQVLIELLKNNPKLNTSQSNLAPDVIKILTKNTKWRHCQAFINKDGSITCFEFLHKAQTPDQILNLDSLIDNLIESERARIQITGSFSKVPIDNISKRKVIGERITRYLRGAIPGKGRRPLMVAYDYYLLDAKPPIPPWPQEAPFNSYISQEIPVAHISQSRFIIKNRNSIVPDIVGLPGNFQNTKQLVELCKKRELKYLGSSKLSQDKDRSSRLKVYFEKRLEEQFKQNQQPQFCLDWILVRLPV